MIRILNSTSSNCFGAGIACNLLTIGSRTINKLHYGLRVQVTCGFRFLAPASEHSWETALFSHAADKYSFRCDVPTRTLSSAPEDCSFPSTWKSTALSTGLDVENVMHSPAMRFARSRHGRISGCEIETAGFGNSRGSVHFEDCFKSPAA